MFKTVSFEGFIEVDLSASGAFLLQANEKMPIENLKSLLNHYKEVPGDMDCYFREPEDPNVTKSVKYGDLIKRHNLTPELSWDRDKIRKEIDSGNFDFILQDGRLYNLLQILTSESDSPGYDFLGEKEILDSPVIILYRNAKPENIST